jgi:hypothetical protein
MNLITLCRANFCNIQGLGTSPNHKRVLHGIPCNDAFTALVITHFHYVVYLSLLTFVTIALSLSVERVNAVCCGRTRHTTLNLGSLITSASRIRLVALGNSSESVSMGLRAEVCVMPDMLGM